MKLLKLKPEEIKKNMTAYKTMPTFTTDVSKVSKVVHKSNNNFRYPDTPYKSNLTTFLFNLFETCNVHINGKLCFANPDFGYCVAVVNEALKINDLPFDIDHVYDSHHWYTGI